MIPYDKRSGKIWYNNELVDWANAKIHILNHGITMLVVFLKVREFMMVQSLN